MTKYFFSTSYAFRRAAAFFWPPHGFPESTAIGIGEFMTFCWRFGGTQGEELALHSIYFDLPNSRAFIFSELVSEFAREQIGLCKGRQRGEEDRRCNDDSFHLRFDE